MVGVPGRSRACQPCKKRRVACDLQHPTCTRCSKAKRDCTYGNDRIFVLNDDGGHKTMYRKTDSTLASPINGATNGATKQSLNGSSSSSSTDDGLDPLHFNGVGGEFPDHPVAETLLLQRPKDGALMQQALIGHALDGNQVHSTPTVSTLASAITSGDLIGTTLQSPFLACYTSWLGRRSKNQRLVDASREFYIQALASTHRALTTPSTAYADATLGACNALGIYEALECPDGTMKAYYWHRAASYRLVEMRGPEAHQDGAAHRLFTNFRFFGILHAFDNGHPTFLAEPAWLTIPFLTHPKTKFDELIDIFALGALPNSLGKSLPGLAKEQQFATALEILGRLAVIRSKLQEFYSGLEEEARGPLYWERVAPSRSDVVIGGSIGAVDEQESSSSDFVFPPALWFDSLEMASMLTLYWAIQAMVYSGLSDLYSLFEEHSITPLFHAAIGSDSDSSSDLNTPQSMHFMWLDRARKVLQSIAFCTTKKALEMGPPRCTTQLAIVVDIMKSRKGCEAEFKWALKALKLMGKRWLRLLNSFPDTPKTQP